jgi:hypothetical protein
MRAFCYNAGIAMGQPNNAGEQVKKCTDAMRAMNDASGFVAYLYEQRSHLTGQPMPSKYACSGKPSLGAPHPDAKGMIGDVCVEVFIPCARNSEAVSTWHCSPRGTRFPV